MKQVGRNSNLSPSRPSALFAWSARIALVCFFCAASAYGQEKFSPDGAAAPPIKYVPSEERSRLDAARDDKARTRLSIELAEARLNRAAELTSMEQFDAASLELGIYEAIIDDAVRRLRGHTKVSNKTRDLFKRLETSIRGHLPRLETIRRATPLRHALNVRATMEFVRRSRTDALNSFYDDTVLRDPNKRTKNAQQSEQARDSSPAASEGERKPKER